MAQISQERYFEDMSSLQVVLTSNTNAVDKNNIRCLPVFMNKKYLNRHVFDGLHTPWSINNEIYRAHEKIILKTEREELYALLSIYWYNHTFNYLTGVAKDAAQSFKLHRNLHRGSFGVSYIITEVEQSISDLIKDCFSDWSNLNLTQKITWTTYKLLDNTYIM